VIHTFHGHVMSGYFPAHVSFAIRMTERILAAFSDIICVLAPQQQRDLVERFRIAPARKFRVIPLGLELGPFHKLAPTVRAEGWLTVGWLGRMVEVKNLPLLLEVMREVFQSGARIRFIVAGDGTQRKLMEEAVRRWGPERLEWLGWTPDVAGVVSRCDVLIQTSRNEGTPVALIQGMAAGRPFVSTPAGGVVDMVSGSGVRESSGGQWFSNAVLVEPDARLFASVLCRFQQDDKRLHAMGIAASAFAMSHYNLELLAQNYSRLYAALLAEKGGLRWRERREQEQTARLPGKL
jgi:glycosyltransferase involved in cell wall biosynthesis